MKDFGDKITEGQEDPQYMFLNQVWIKCIIIINLIGGEAGTCS
jgi:hypothetical protein